jgi:hypothetical protein
MENGLKRLEEQILEEYLDSVQRIQPELERHFFYDVMPPWEVYREYRLEELAHESRCKRKVLKEVT